MQKVLAKWSRKLIPRTYELAYRLAVGGQLNLRLRAFSDYVRPQVEARCRLLFRAFIVVVSVVSVVIFKCQNL